MSKKPITKKTASKKKPTSRKATKKKAAKKAATSIALPQVNTADKRHAKRLRDMLAEHYPDAHCELDYTAPHELLIATILSAQCTDVAVNKATPALFKKFPAPADYAKSTPEAIEPYVKTLGFYRNKAKSVHAAMSAVVSDFGGEIPSTMEELLTLRGVARKTANVVLSNAFNINLGFVVDTHVMRLSRRLGLIEESEENDPVKIEKKLMALFAQEDWGLLSHLLIFHGRRACKARMASCADHPVCKKFGQNCELCRE
ncbi:MAG: endonuclease III [Phycisphaerales bacterium]|nr:endonuclease III [Phycisphaerales bacterium]MCB9836504.1 endonuclease III [Phycisphaera sp.]